jgi:hypothetical protein
MRLFSFYQQASDVCERHNLVPDTVPVVMYEAYTNDPL